ncbi:MAG: cardiolipin synthase [Myxococcota bacterium]|jgi:cardiolipin synthase
MDDLPSDSPAVPDDISTGFVPDIIRELGNLGYGVAGWQRFFGRAWVRALANVRARPNRCRSTHRWMAFATVLLCSVLVVAQAPIRQSALAIGWFILISSWVYIHQGLIRTVDDRPFDRFLIPNGLSYLRFSLSGLIPVLFDSPWVSGAWALSLLFSLGILDLFDGFLARRLDEQSRLGRLLDPMADLAFVTWLATTLHNRELLDGWLYWLIIARYPGMLVAGVVVFFWHGPFAIHATSVGKLTGLVVDGFLVFSAAHVLVGSPMVAFIAGPVGVLIITNLLYLAVVFRRFEPL